MSLTLTLPQVTQASLNPPTIDASKLPARYLWPGELECIIALVASVRPRRVLEIGCNTGRTARAILDNVPGITAYVGVDVPPGYAFGCKVQAKEVPSRPGFLAAEDPRFQLLLTPHGSRDIAPGDLEGFDAIFIDGDHSEQAVLLDTELALGLLEPGGILIWHDYHDRCDASGKPEVGVADALHQVAAQGLQIQHVAGTWLAFASMGGRG